MGVTSRCGGSGRPGTKRKQTFMRINKTTGHAIRIMLACAHRDGQLVKAATLADELGISLQNVLKIIHLLTHQGLVAATRGRNGGVQLARPATAINIGSIVRGLETIDLEEDGVAASHPDLTPDVANLLDDALLAFIAVLEKHSLAEIAALQARKGGARPAGRKVAQRQRKTSATRASVAGKSSRRGNAVRRSSELE